MKPHKHAKVIKAWADGAEIQCQSHDGHWWYERHPTWDENTIYRAKPNLKTSQRYYATEDGVTPYSKGTPGIRVNLKLTWDCVTRKLTKAEVI